MDTATTTYTIFCDEAGHTGTNYLDPDQPFYVSAGWLLDHSASCAPLNLARPRGGQSLEFKAAQALKSERGQAEIMRVFDDLRRLGGVPLFYLGEKRYLLAERVAATLLDVHTNPDAGWVDIGQGWPAIIQGMYRLSDPTLARFAQLYHRPSRPSFEETIEAISSELADAHPRLAATIAGASKHVDAIFGHDLDDRVGFRHFQLSSPNLAALLNVIRLADQFVEFRQGSLEVVHDESLRYADAYGRYVSMLTWPGRSVEGPTLGGKIRRLGFRTVAGFRATDSRTTPHLQAADYLASGVLRLTQAAAREEAWTPALVDMAKLTLLGLTLSDSPPFGGICAGEALKAKITMALVRHVLPGGRDVP